MSGSDINGSEGGRDEVGGMDEGGLSEMEPTLVDEGQVGGQAEQAQAEQTEQSQTEQAEDKLQEEEEDDDDFDDFNEPVQAELAKASDGDNDFGSFDDGNMAGAGTVHESSSSSSSVPDSINSILDKVFTIEPPNTTTEIPLHQLLNERSTEVLHQLATMPHLKPNNWTKLRIRHNLLIKLGIPINLDEIADDKTAATTSANKTIFHNRRRSVNEDDINWDQFKVADFKDLKMSTEDKDKLLATTNEILSKIETDNLNNSSESYLNGSSEESLKQKLAQFQANYQQLLELSSVWQYQFKDLKHNFEVYESVVQNLIGYSQKQERDQLLQNLKQLKDKSSKRRWRK